MTSTVTPYADMDPSPRVGVLIDAADLNVSTVTITVYRSGPWGQFPVRGAEGVASAGGFFVTDYEPPVGVALTYTVEQFDAGGASLGFALSLPTQVNIALGQVVFSDPLAPANAVMVDGRSDFAGVVKRSRDTAIYRVGGRTVALSGLQSKVQQVSLRCSTRTIAAADALASILAESVVLVRTMPDSVRIPSAVYAVVPDVVEVPQDVQWGGAWIVWDIDGHELDRPGLEVLVPTYTWQDLIDYYATWTALIAAYPTWLDVSRTPPPS